MIYSYLLFRVHQIYGLIRVYYVKVIYFLDLIETFYHIHPYLMTHQMNLKCIRILQHTYSLFEKLIKIEYWPLN
jgi:hypothetical protein